MKRCFMLFAVLGVLIAQPARTDELRPGYLELRQTAPGTYSLLFKIPARGDDLRLAIYLNLPEGTQDVGPPRASFSDGAYVERRRLTYWFGSKALPAPYRPSGFRRQGRRSSFRPHRAREKSRRPICALALSTSCSASIISCLFWHW